MASYAGDDSPLGSSLLGSAADLPVVRRHRFRTMLISFLVGANLLGIAITLVLITLVIPGPDVVFGDEFRAVNTILLPIFVIVVVAVGAVVGSVRTVPAVAWAYEDRAATRDEQIATLATPWRLAELQAGLWVAGLVGVSVIDGIIAVDSVAKVVISIGLGGAVSCAFGYLLAEFALRPVAARALDAGDPRRARVAGVQGRTFLTWSLGTGVPVLGLISVALSSMFVERATPAEFERAILVLGSIALVIGAGLLFLSGAATMAPIRAVRSAMRAVERGDTDVRVEVFDGTELGELQSGFNSMAAGLKERERIRNVFGLQVGHQVARAALSTDPVLGGEERDVAVLFVDVVGSTELAVSTAPSEVVALLNRFFQVVVDEVDAHGGIIDKFEGDAALAVFGAPETLTDPYERALRAASAMAVRLRAEVPDAAAAIGVASGRVVAGNVGARTRFEYTVIGDPVNEAARLSELAKTLPGRTVASAVTVERADPDVRSDWTLTESVVLRGRSSFTQLAVPSSDIARV